MAGLLDTFNNDSTRFSLGLLAAAAPRADQAGFGQRVQEALAGVDANRANKQRMDLQKMQIDNYKSEIEQRNAAIAKNAQIQQALQGLLGNGGTSPGAFAPSIDGMGPTMPPEMQRPGGIGGATIDQITKLKALGGPDLLEAFKWANDPLKMDQGAIYKDRVTGKERYIPKVGEGMAPDTNGFYAPLPGYADGQATIEGAKARATEAAKAGYDLQTITPQNEAPQLTTRAAAVSRINGGAPAASSAPASTGPVVAPATQAARDTERTAILNAELRKAQMTLSAATRTGDAAAAARAQADVDALSREIGRTKPSVGIPLQSPAEAAKAQAAAVQPITAGNDVNTTWLKSSYEPTMAAGKTADEMISSVQVGRQALKNMGGTGWGTETKAAAAGMLSGLGIAPDNAKMYAANSQVFQKTAMDRLLTTLQSQVGPQTEGDASRAQQTYAKLQNTTKANEFILDLAEARAQREKMKSNFYTNALPIARQKGDLQEVDREWQTRAPSIFDMPGMKKWAGGVK